MHTPLVPLLASLLLACASSPTASQGPSSPSRKGATRKPAIPEPKPVALHSGAVSKVVKELNRLSVELYKRVDKEGNTVASPLSVATALSVLELGTREESAAALHTLLGASDPARHRLGLRVLLQQLRGGGERIVSEYDDILYPHELTVSSSIWVDKTFPLEKAYRKSAADSYRAVATRVDFRNPEDATAQVNKWVARATNNKIKNITGPESFAESVRLLLFNVVYFRGSWSYPFTSVKQAPFHVDGAKETAEVRMMTKVNYGSSTQNDEVTIVDLAYVSASKGVNLTMTVLLPKKRDGLAALEKGLSNEKLQQWLAEMHGGAVDVYLPMWHAESTLDFSNALTELGIGALFGAEADLSGVSRKRGLHLGAVKHTAYIEVDQTGTEAAGATEFSAPCAAPFGEFRADHPFLYLIRDRKSGAILFIGRVVDPRKP